MIEAVGRAVSIETETIKPQFGFYHGEAHGFGKGNLTMEIRIGQRE